jgi:hypothetical protein
MTNAKKTYTEAEATDEAFRLLRRKFQRLAPEAFLKAWEQMPEGAHLAMNAAENRADRLRMSGDAYEFPAEADLDESDE